MLILLLLACRDEDVAETPVAGGPSARLEARAAGLADAARRVFGPDEDDLRDAADLLDRTDRRLVRLLVSARPGVPVEDLAGEANALRVDRTRAAGRPDLRAAGVGLDGTVVRGRLEGPGIVETGGMVLLDTRGGPAPDVSLSVDAAGVQVAPVDSWVTGPAVAVPAEVAADADTLTFSVDLATSGRWTRGADGTVRLGGAVARMRREGVDDDGPTGLPVAAEPDALRVLAAMLARGADDPDADPAEDPDLSVALALGFGPWRAWVAPEVRPRVEADASAWLAYGLGLDDWLEARGATWSLGALPADAKLAWAWPGGQSVSYGALAVSRATEPLSAARYRWAGPDVATLVAWRDRAPLSDDPRATAEAVDDAHWERMRYRASDAAMEAVCADRTVRFNDCGAWENDRDHGKDLGWIDGVRVPMDGAVSATQQLDLVAREGAPMGDCATATTLTLATLQALGVPGLAVGYAGDSWATPTHDMPLVYDAGRFFPLQPVPSARWAAEPAWVYVHVPVVTAVGGASLGWEPGGWARGAAVPGGRTTYGALSPWLEAGVPLSSVLDWVEDGAAGRWGVVSP